MQDSKKRLGDLLTENKLITPDQLTEALKRQKLTKKKLGHILMDMGHITEDQLLKVLTKQFKVPTVHLADNIINPIIIKMIPPKICLKYTILPILLEGNT